MINGSGVVMRYPPEQAPAFHGIENVAEKIAADAIAAIKEETGQDIPRSRIRLDPIPGGQTSDAYWRGQSPPYLLSWQDDKGIMHMVNPGRGFVAEPGAITDEQILALLPAPPPESETKQPRVVHDPNAWRNPANMRPVAEMAREGGRVASEEGAILRRSIEHADPNVFTVEKRRGFVADVNAMREEQTAEREKKFTEQREIPRFARSGRPTPLISVEQGRDDVLRDVAPGATGMRKELNAARRKLNARGDLLPDGGGVGGY